MLGFELTRGHPRRRGILIAVVTVGFLALLGLRTEYLTIVAGDSFPVAVFQSTLLTAISAGLVLCGSAVLTRTRTVMLLAGPRRRPARRPGRRGRPARAARGRRQAGAAHRHAAPDDPPGGAALRRCPRASATPNGPPRSSRPSALSSR